jgi:hypothetical protein
MKRIAVPAAVALLTVVAFITLSGWNRSAPARQQITLSERELRLWNTVPSSNGDDSGVQLHIEIQRRDDPLDARNWLTEERLRALGFSFDVAPGAPEAQRAYLRALPRIAWVAFELNGPAWREIERRLALRPDAPERHGTMIEPSRLVPVDASLDVDTLVARYPKDHLVVRASIELDFLPPANKGPLVFGRIRNVIPSAVTVPREFGDRFLPRGARPPSHYGVELAIGRLGIPYVTGISNVRNQDTQTRRHGGTEKRLTVIGRRVRWLDREASVNTPHQHSRGVLTLASLSNQSRRDR